MTDYYAKSLSAERLAQCYDLAPERVRQYFEAEVDFVRGRLGPGQSVLELGCGYGRVLARLIGRSRTVVGIDNAEASIVMAHRENPQCVVAVMDATALGFAANTFDRVLCIQNGICAFGVAPDSLVTEARRVTRPGGTLIFSTYADAFWPHRLQWFEAQSNAGLLGPIDYDQTGDGVIVCTDGFRSGTMTREALAALAHRHGLSAIVSEVDESSVLCEMSA